MKEGQLITRSDDIMSGTPVFAGTRVPVQTLIDYLEGGDRLDDFLDDFPTVTREQATGVWKRVLAFFKPPDDASREKFLAVLAKVPDVEPEEYDKIP
jgi:uncharacterized protein (DUF433 family)